MDQDSRFFQVGGTLDENARSYIERPADRELVEFLQRGELCMILAPRQTGKSSLMIHTMKELKAQGIKSGFGDLQPLGNHTDLDKWFGDLVYQLERSLKLSTDTGKWWEEHKRLGATQRFMTFMEDVVLDEITGKLVVFFDEVDSVLPLSFSDDFFTTIRALVNARANNPTLRRLTFVLLGAATPSDFIRNKSRTPFNVGREIRLGDFDETSLAPFKKVLGTGSEALVERIFYWTEGHPLMVQKLAETACNWEEPERVPEKVDEEVQSAYLDTSIDKDPHLKFTRDYLLRDKKKTAKTLKIYKDVLAEKAVQHDEQSPEHSTLSLAGVVRIADRKLVCRNPVYKTIFNREWVRKNTPRNVTRTVAIGSTSVLMLVLVWFIFLQQRVMPEFRKYQKHKWLDNDIYYSTDDVFELKDTLPGRNINKITVNEKKIQLPEFKNEIEADSITIPFSGLSQSNDTHHVIRYYSDNGKDNFETNLIIICFPEEKWQPLKDLEMVDVSEGCFEMGCGEWSGVCDEYDKPLHKVCLDGFKIGKYEITQDQWVKLMGYNPSEFRKGENYPVENVSWMHIREFIRRLNKQTGKRYALPTEAQWEYAARSGGKKELYAGGDQLDSLGWYDENSDTSTHPVGLKTPNGLGIHDMSGNVYEWCSDWYGPVYYRSCKEQGVVRNPTGPSVGTYRVLRGGSWSSLAGYCRASYRSRGTPGYRNRNYGFRLVLLSGQ